MSENPKLFEIGINPPHLPNTEITLRDLFAAAALSGMTGDPIRSGAFELYGVDAYKFADAMLAQRERRMK